MADRAPAPDASASAATAEERAAFLAECVQPLRTQRYRDAVRRCTAYTEHPALAGQAHAALAAAYSAPDHADPRASARHAESSAAAGDARGQFMAALHMLSGHTDQPFDLSQAETWLSSAAQQRVPNAQAVLQRLQDAHSCRTQPSFKLLDAPVFCLFKPELDQLLRDQGMLAADSHTDHAWSERWQAGTALAGATAVELDFDRSPVDELLRLARFTYRFDPSAAAQRLPGLAQALQQKYGNPQAGQALAAPGGTARWRLGGGVELRLLRDSDGALAIEYRHAARWQARAEHWAQAERALQLARLRRDQAAL